MEPSVMPLISCWMKYSTGDGLCPTRESPRKLAAPRGCYNATAMPHVQHSTAKCLCRERYFSEQPADLPPEAGQHVALEPGVGRKPGVVAPRWVRQGHLARLSAGAQLAPPVRHDIGHA